MPTTDPTTPTEAQIAACMAEAEEVAAEFRSVLASSDADDLRDDVAYRLATRDAALAAAEREAGELRAALLNERGEGPWPDGWQWLPSGHGRGGFWKNWNLAPSRGDYHGHVSWQAWGRWEWIVYHGNTHAKSGTAPTAREAMRQASASLTPTGAPNDR
jgi:hypothetical protein